ncbi:hypothetical protein LTR78_005340 [Recurvomyces mirabilis]|uniref:SMP-30/Gluconolactonase/LRE-like region domain-containing protein n=1 Tax=Recurvomyces mirabilis TaxID=574656 RepID=A0AAE0WMM8_9PEZI|nr:hypothetical protein LTR78_005340 [Recurvomyces mirabilis]KAK5152753.1 hypothetical protein LTS14_008287 [Recurvomyces mirabilis]
MTHLTLGWSIVVLLLTAFLQHTLAFNTSIFQIIQPVFETLLGPTPQIEVLVKASGGQQLYHEGGAYHEPSGALWVASDGLANATNRRIFRVTGLGSPATVHVESINHTIANPIGAHVNVPGSPLGDVILFVAQGSLAKMPPAGVYAMNPYPPYNTSLVIGSYGDNPFNSLDDITVTPDGVIFISDPPYGYGQGNRPKPLLPNQVYSYNPFTNDLRVAADGFVRPNGLAASPDGNTIYVADTGALLYENVPLDTQGFRTIYAFDRVNGFLTNRRVFAMPQAFASAADGIRVDSYGNVWASVAGQGISVWDKSGTLLGDITIDNNGGNLGLADLGELYLLGGDTIFKVSVSTTVRHA